jgi:hypothetical protein
LAETAIIRQKVSNTKVTEILMNVSQWMFKGHVQKKMMACIKKRQLKVVHFQMLAFFWVSVPHKV